MKASILGTQRLTRKRIKVTMRVRPIAKHTILTSYCPVRAATRMLSPIVYYLKINLNLITYEH